ncbi:hypothetical protein [Microbacterium sp.]|uniref:hypothetical protein n=1 Tax=Microbacterium sp. TaxID=51671 RepID=UPI0035639A87
MTQTPNTATANPDASASRPSRRAIIGLWIGAAALLLSAGLIVHFLPVPALLVAAAGAALLAVIAVVLGIRGQRSSVPRTGSAALLVAATALIVDLILIVVIAVGVLTGSSGLSQVEVRATGGPAFTVSYADDTQSYDEEWSDSGWKQYTTTGDTAEITVTASDDDAVATVSCEILWNGESVVEQSGVGSVTCRYDAN